MAIKGRKWLAQKFRFEWLQVDNRLVCCIVASDATEFPGVSWDEDDIHSSVYGARSFLRNISACLVTISIVRFLIGELWAPRFRSVTLRILIFTCKMRNILEKSSSLLLYWIFLSSLRTLDKKSHDYDIGKSLEQLSRLWKINII